MSKTRYQNMTAGYTLAEAGRKIGTFPLGDTIGALQQAGIRPNGGTLKAPRFDRRLVDQLAEIRHSQGRVA